jgi:hypothetical protein
VIGLAAPFLIDGCTPPPSLALRHPPVAPGMGKVVTKALCGGSGGPHINVSELACFTIGMGGDFCAHDQCSEDKVKTRIDPSGFYKGRATTYSGQQSKLYWGCTAYSNFLTNSDGVAWLSDPDLILDNEDEINSWPFCTGARS